ncbi:MAG TPA: hypothetical protein VIW24_21530 [Aldersonia sp.]
MGRKRGFFAELQHQQRLAEQRQRREHASAVRAHNAAVREADRAQREYERAVAEAERAADRQRWEAEARARAAREKALHTDAEAKTQQALSSFEQIDSILAATLEVDDYVDIATLKQKAEHPPFTAPGLETPTPKPRLESLPSEPQFAPPPEPTGMSKVFGKKRHAEVVAQAHAAWTQEHQQWSIQAHRVIPERNAKLLEEHAAAEKRRLERLAAAQQEYERDCAARERSVVEANAKLNQFAQALADNHPQAIHEYVGIVLGNSVYPDAFEVEYDYEFDAGLSELTVSVIVPPPSDMPAVKLYKYMPKTGDTRESPCTQKEQRERYNGAVAAVAVRTFHEVFESDREGRIQTISLTVQTETANPATGLVESFPLVAAAADRTEFSSFDLGNVDPTLTLDHMRASVSKNAFALKRISTARGVR